MLYECTYLAHYGIKGQKWGFRRFQNEDGTLTEEGLRRYGIGDGNEKWTPKASIRMRYNREKQRDADIAYTIRQEKKNGTKISQRRKDLTQKYIDKGMTREQAEIQAFKRANVEKFVKVAGAIALTAAVAYGAYKGSRWLTNNMDRSIRKGSEIFRIQDSGNVDARPAFVTDKVKDAVKYKGLYGQQIDRNQFIEKMQNGGTGPVKGVFQIRGHATDKIRVAGQKNAAKVYKELMKDPEFSKDTHSMLSNWREYMRQVGQADEWDKKTAYQRFNTMLVSHDTPEAARIQKKFYDALARKGYSGVMDVNDKMFSGYNSKNPVILFNLREKLGNVSYKKLNNIEIGEAAVKARNMIAKEEFRKTMANEAFGSVKKTGIYTGLMAALGLGSLGANEVSARNSTKRYRAVIAQYKKEHPKTKLTDQQILENELGSQR